jgi:hypothetical protein
MALQKKRKWLYSTLSTKIASLAGALRLLPLYTDNHPAIHMSLSTIWGQAAKASAQAEKLTAPRRAAPASWSDVAAILVREKHSRASIAILLAWLTCGRVADVLRLKPNDIIIGAERLTVTFRDTKTRNTYTVATALPPAQHITIFTDVIESATYARPVFHDNLKAQISRALKAQRPALTQHSLRRGAIQTLAKSGVSAKHLLNFSGHKTMASLLTYLDDGITAPGLDLQTAQARVLVGGGSNDDPSEAPPPAPPPSTNEVFTCFPNPDSEKRPPIHMKPVTHMSLERLRALPMGDDTRDYLEKALRWLDDPEMYTSALDHGAPIRSKYKAPAFTDTEMRQMLGIKFGPLPKQPPHVRPRPVYGFPVLQHKAGKTVLRPIWEPAVNDAVADLRAQELHLPRRDTVLEDSLPSSKEKHIWCQLDGVSCFDQVPLGEAIRHFFTFVWDGDLQSLLSLPMGFRRAVEVACAILWALLDFPRPACVRVNSYVDNARFGGPAELTAAAVLTFVSRCKACNYQLDHSPSTIDEVHALSPTSDTFLGVLYNYKDSTRCLPPKAIVKLRAIQSATRELTHRQLACVIGLISWCGTILDYAWHSCWHLLRRYASCAIGWVPTQRITLTPKEWQELQHILSVCLRNSPVPIKAPPPPPVDMVLITDASKTGWGALAGRQHKPVDDG